MAPFHRWGKLRQESKWLRAAIVTLERGPLADPRSPVGQRPLHSFIHSFSR